MRLFGGHDANLRHRPAGAPRPALQLVTAGHHDGIDAPHCLRIDHALAAHRTNAVVRQTGVAKPGIGLGLGHLGVDGPRRVTSQLAHASQDFVDHHLLRYATDSFSTRNFATLEKDDAYWMELRTRYAEGLSNIVASIPPPPNWG